MKLSDVFLKAAEIHDGPDRTCGCCRSIDKAQRPPPEQWGVVEGYHTPAHVKFTEYFPWYEGVQPWDEGMKYYEDVGPRVLALLFMYHICLEEEKTCSAE